MASPVNSQAAEGAYLPRTPSQLLSQARKQKTPDQMPKCQAINKKTLVIEIVKSFTVNEIAKRQGMAHT